METDSNYVYRLTADAALLGCLLFFPWWVAAVLSLVFLFYFSTYVEIILLGFIMDALYGSRDAGVHSNFTFVFIAIVVFTLFAYLKRRLKFY